MTAPGRFAPPGPALGPLPSVGRRGVVLRIGVVVCLLALAVLVRNTGVVRADDTGSELPPMPGAAAVVPGVLRGGAPSDSELVQLHESFRVWAVVALGGAGAEEKAVARDLGIQVLELDVDDVSTPTADRLVELVAFVREVTSTPGRAVYLHDATGAGPGLIVTAVMLQVLEDPAARSGALARIDPAERARLDAGQLSAVQSLVAAVRGEATAGNPYSPLREVAR